MAGPGHKYKYRVVAKTPTSNSPTAKKEPSPPTYHYRLIATNEGGTTKGEDRTFTTPRTFSPPTYVSSFDSKGTGNGQFTSPWGLAADASGNVWVVDAGTVASSRSGLRLVSPDASFGCLWLLRVRERRHEHERDLYRHGYVFGVERLSGTRNGR